MNDDELAARARLARGLAEIHNPIALATRYLASRHLLGGPDEDDLMDVAIQSIVDAALAWHPGAGRSMASWAWLYLDRNINRELTRLSRRHRELAGPHGACTCGQHTGKPCPIHDPTAYVDWLEYDPRLDDYQRVVDRVTLQRWADLAVLNPLMRFMVEYFALHHGTYVRDTPLAGAPTPLHGSGYPTLKLALKHLRNAAVTGRRRDDKWTRRHDHDDARARRSGALLERLRAVEAERDTRLTG